MEHFFTAKSTAEAFPLVLLFVFIGYFAIVAGINSSIEKQKQRRRTRRQSSTGSVPRQGDRL